MPNSILLLVACFTVLTSASRPPSILVAPLDAKAGRETLLLIVPIAPSEDYRALATAIQTHSSLRLSVGIAVCDTNFPVLNVTFCEPVHELPEVLDALITRANASSYKLKGGGLLSTDVFVSGHSVGGSDARRYVDTQFAGPAGGVLFFGTQYTGDGENMLTSKLGYPTNLSNYKTPMLGMTGELDKFSIDNIAPVVKQWSDLTSANTYRTYPVIIPGMDQSSYSYPSTMKNDLRPEISQSDSLTAIGEIVGEWLDYVSSGYSSSTTKLAAAAKTTVALSSPFLGALALDKNYCQTQQMKFPGVPENTEIEVVKVPGSKLDSCHTKYVVKANGSLKLTLCDYTTYTYHDQPPWEPQYAGAKDIACKFISEDRIAQLLNLTLPDMKSAAVLNRCQSLNKDAFTTAKGLIQQHWPRAVTRFAKSGKNMTFKDDAQTYAGPQWLLEGLGYVEASDSITVQGTALITTVKSWIYPGAHYCKLLSPSKAIDIMMTMGLTDRYPK